MLKTEVTYYLPEELITSFDTEDYPTSGLGWDVDTLVANLKAHTLSFLDFKNIPIIDLDQGELGIAPEVWLDQYDHIAGVKEGFYLLFEIHCFNLNRNSDSEVAYAHLLRAINCMHAITTATLEAQYFAGQARRGDNFKATEREQRRSRMFSHYCQLRDAGKSNQESRRIAAKRLGISERTKRTYWKIDEIEAEYQACKS